MSDIQDPTKQERDDSSFDQPAIVRSEWEGRQTDWLLQWFVKFINQTSTQTGVTLTVGGSQIAGDLISHQVYFERLADGFSEAFRKFEGVDVQAIKDMILGFDQPLEPPADGEPAPFQYLHLANVTVISGDRPITIQNGLWRGKIAAVEGFILGR